MLGGRSAGRKKSRRWRAKDPAAKSSRRARKLFARALETPGGLKIQTIHAFCESVLHQFPLEANIAAHFEMLDPLMEEALFGAAPPRAAHRRDGRRQAASQGSLRLGAGTRRRGAGSTRCCRKSCATATACAASSMRSPSTIRPMPASMPSSASSRARRRPWSPRRCGRCRGFPPAYIDALRRRRQRSTRAGAQERIVLGHARGHGRDRSGAAAEQSLPKVFSNSQGRALRPRIGSSTRRCFPACRACRSATRRPAQAILAARRPPGASAHGGKHPRRADHRRLADRPL